MRILIVEDNNVSRIIMLKMLEPIGECDTAEDGTVAVEMVEKALKEKQPFNLITLDITMVNLDGFETLKKIRQLEEDNNLNDEERSKIIMNTARDDSKNIIQAFSEKCDGYLIKPVRKDDLTNELTRLGLI